MKKKTPEQIVGYVRVSTRAQGLDGLGMEAQRQAVYRYAQANDLPVVAIYEEVETGRKADLRNRPQLTSALAHVRRSGALLVIARLDRLARNVFVTSQLLESGIEFVACDNPHATRLTIQILAAMAEHESALISARVKAAMAAAAERGTIFRGGRLSAEAIRLGIVASALATKRRTREAYADLVPLVRDLRTQGHAASEIARRLNEHGHTNQFGRMWSTYATMGFLHREGLSNLRIIRKYENHLSGKIQAMGAIAARAAVQRQTDAYYRPYVELLRMLYEAGRSSVEIAAELNRREIRTRGGSTWYSSIVLAVLRRFSIAPPPRAKQTGLLNPVHWSKGQKAAIRAKQVQMEQHRGRNMPIIRWLLEERHTYAEIASHLNSHDFKTPMGKEWTRKTLSQYVYRSRTVRKRRASRLKSS